MALVLPPNPADTPVKNPQRWDTPFTPGIDPVEFDRACHDEAWGCAYSRVWRTYLDVIREAA